MWSRAVRGDPWEFAQATIVVLATITAIACGVALSWGWMHAGLVAGALLLSCVVSFALLRRRYATFVSCHTDDGIQQIIAMLAVAAAIDAEHVDPERGES
jgi:hypothetical protein